MFYQNDEDTSSLNENLKTGCLFLSNSDKWTLVNVALSPIDRPDGILYFFHNNIGSTHVAHHSVVKFHFTKMIIK